ncbi:hypothetical protein AAC387_Pa04g0438 [Persea americana]
MVFSAGKGRQHYPRKYYCNDENALTQFSQNPQVSSLKNPTPLQHLSLPPPTTPNQIFCSPPTTPNQIFYSPFR